MIKSTCGFCGKPTERRKQTKNVKIHFCDIQCKSDHQRLQKPVTKEWLIEHYINKEMDCVVIGKLVNRDPKSVWNWLKDFDIPTRPRGDASRLVHDGSTFRGKHHSPETRKRLSDIAIAEGRVPYDPKVGSYMKGRSGKDHPQWKGGVTPERQAVYASLEWIEAVKAVWKRADAKCERCNKHHNTQRNRGNFHIHHIVSFAVRELRTEVSNLILLCKECHRWVHSPANKEKELIKEFKNNER